MASGNEQTKLYAFSINQQGPHAARDVMKGPAAPLHLKTTLSDSALAQAAGYAGCTWLNGRPVDEVKVRRRSLPPPQSYDIAAARRRLPASSPTLGASGAPPARQAAAATSVAAAVAVGEAVAAAVPEVANSSDCSSNTLQQGSTAGGSHRSSNNSKAAYSFAPSAAEPSLFPLPLTSASSLLLFHQPVGVSPVGGRTLCHPLGGTATLMVARFSTPPTGAHVATETHQPRNYFFI